MEDTSTFISVQGNQFIPYSRDILRRNLPSASRSQNWKQLLLSRSLSRALDRVNVLGDDRTGHTGCVNALSWAQGGQILLTGGDDTTVRIWKSDSANAEHDYPFVCEAIIETGHRGNIFNNQMLPFSSRIATVAGDKQVRVFDISSAVGNSIGARETSYSTRESCIRVFRCHKGRTKRIITEDSPDLFLTLGEDGAVRQHDLRHPHICGSGACPPPLIQLPRELSAIAQSPLTPYQIVVAGESPYGYLFDRRQAGRILKEEWGMVPDSDDVVTCVRRFGRKSRGPGERKGSEHVTGARMAESNGHEVLLSYSGDAVYLFSTRDSPGRVDDFAATTSSVVTPNAKRRKVDEAPPTVLGDHTSDDHRESSDIEMEDDFGPDLDAAGIPIIIPPNRASADEGDGDDEEDDDDDELGLEQPTAHGNVPLILPRRRFAGACNIRTVKDVNFLGPQDEFVVSGSDDGNFFMWKKATGSLHGVYEGDGSVVNVIEGHPHLPLVAVSGIDTTVKLFAPARGPSAFSRMQDAESILEHNRQASEHPPNRRISLAGLLLQYDLAMRASGVGDDSDGTEGNEGPTCTFQ
ncbi:hypothetical protein JAAARDRAFT_187861 [Jaapia argillacea MUCL 33604]|uniref:WD40 repeat-like protein n=1 Tax=Jaapia argillacea MUCL 33604 TaxID=933084 RepID=A0A067QC68_9AGAM|nr:hypothetical protein JAAARDRAFT_187861 [Jaapia argillacea MUCL 33604]